MIGENNIYSLHDVRLNVEANVLLENFTEMVCPGIEVRKLYDDPKQCYAEKSEGGSLLIHLHFNGKKRTCQIQSGEWEPIVESSHCNPEDDVTLNYCYQCANETLKTKIDGDEKIRRYMSDTWLCSICHKTNEVYNEEVITLQQQSTLSIEEWRRKYPRVIKNRPIDVYLRNCEKEA